MIIKLDTIDSTNRYGLREFANFADNTLIVSDSQDAGRGRRGKSWHSPAGKNIYASYLIKGDQSLIEKSLWICGLAALKTLREHSTDLALWLKWPNDIYCTPKNNPSQYLKIAGLLAEMHSPAGSNTIDGVVAGMGINLNMTNSDLEKIDQPATSILNETGKEVNIANFADNLLQNLSFYRTIFEENINQLYIEWKSENGLIGKTITLQKDDNKIISGKVTDVTRNGILVLLTPDGSIHEIVTGNLVRISK